MSAFGFFGRSAAAAPPGSVFGFGASGNSDGCEAVGEVGEAVVLRCRLMTGEMRELEVAPKELVGSFRRRFAEKFSQDGVAHIMIVAGDQVLLDDVLAAPLANTGDLTIVHCDTRFAAAMMALKEAERVARLHAVMTAAKEDFTLEEWLRRFDAAGGKQAELLVRGGQLTCAHMNGPIAELLVREQMLCDAAPLPDGLRLLVIRNNYRNDFEKGMQEGDNLVRIDGEVVLGGDDVVHDVVFAAAGTNHVNVRSSGGVSYVDRKGTTLSLDGEVLIRDFDEYNTWHAGRERLAERVSGPTTADTINTALNREFFDSSAAATLVAWLCFFFAKSGTVNDGYGS